ncbi:MAG: cellulase family glycosylhydrolase [Bacteroidales bacterium]|nr:cellulase family glycosylhydrolase [Bacteroidales bacterium]
MNRREFIRVSAVAGSALGLSRSSQSTFELNSGTTDVTFNTLPQWRGFNLLEKFTDKPDEWLTVAPEWGYRNEPFKESDFAIIKELGFNFVRLPMSYKCWTEEDDWYKLKEKHLKEIDQAVEFGREYGLHVSINFHRSPGYTINDMHFLPEYKEKTSIWDDEETLKACAFHWRHFAGRYKGIPSSRLSFNLFNEPTGTTEEKHDKVIRSLVKEIRTVDQNRLIAIDGYDFNPSISLLDLKIAQCARGYTPGVLTHYKSTWNKGNDALPIWPMKDHNGILWDRVRLEEHFKPWEEIEKKGIGVYVGEFGVYNKTPHDVTLRFLKDNLEIWKLNKWGWAMWCFRGSFGIFNSGRADVKYEKYKGLLLDRKMLELLKETV